ncbi:MAG: ankyrin repeat domain-containing protein [Wolbachia sp.]
MNEREQMELNEQLMNAAQEGKVGQTMEMIEAGADINAENKEGETPLCVAAMKGYSWVVELLLIAGANVNVDVLAETSFNFVFEVGSKVKVFYKGNMNLAKRLGQAPLHIAVMENHTEGVELLLNRGADVNAENKGGETPLYVAAVYHLIDIAKILIKYIMLCDYHTTKPNYIVNNSELSEFWDYYQKKMEDVKLSNSTISLYQFLRETDENELAGYLSNKEYDEIRRSDVLEYISEFPEHTDAIVSQFDKAWDRRDLLDKSKAAIPSQNLDNPSAEQLQAAAQAHN